MDRRPLKPEVVPLMPQLVLRDLPVTIGLISSVQGAAKPLLRQQTANCKVIQGNLQPLSFVQLDSVATPPLPRRASPVKVPFAALVITREEAYATVVFLIVRSGGLDRPMGTF